MHLEDTFSPNPHSANLLIKVLRLKMYHIDTRDEENLVKNRIGQNLMPLSDVLSSASSRNCSSSLCTSRIHRDSFFRQYVCKNYLCFQLIRGVSINSGSKFLLFRARSIIILLLESRSAFSCSSSTSALTQVIFPIVIFPIESTNKHPFSPITSHR